MEGSLYVATESGLYYHVDGGSIMEKIINGNITDMGNPENMLGRLLCRQNGEFLISYTSFLRNYQYDPNMTTVPEHEITLYALHDNFGIKKALSAYQKEHPDIYINFEVGMRGQDGMTEEDALKTFNTELMAGAVSGEFAGLQNYITVFKNQAYQLAAKNTAAFVLVCLPLLILLSLVTALCLAKRKKVQLLKSLYLFPMAVPAATLVLIWKNLGYTIMLWLAGILGISETILEAYLVAGAYPHESMYLLQHLFNNWFLNLELDKMAAAAVYMKYGKQIQQLFLLLLVVMVCTAALPDAQAFCGNAA